MRLAPAIFPDAVVGFQGELACLLAERLEKTEQPFVAGPRQPPVVEHRRRSQDDAAIGIVLLLLHRGVADAHRTVAAIAFQVGDVVSSIGSRRNDAVDRPHLLVWDSKRCSR